MIASVAAIVFAVVTSAVVGFQFALALGAPWGAYAMDRHCVVRPATVVLQHYGGRQHRAARLQGNAYRRPAVTRSGDGRGVATAASLPTPDRRRRPGPQSHPDRLNPTYKPTHASTMARSEL